MKKLKQIVTFDFFIPKPYRVHIIYWLIMLNIIIFHQLYDQYRGFEQFVVAKTNTQSFAQLSTHTTLLAIGREELRPRTEALADKDDDGERVLSGGDRGTGTVHKISIGAKGSLADKNNNPGNLRFANQQGAERGYGGFARFRLAEEGYNALLRQIDLDKKRNHTVKSFLAKYAPEGDYNNVSVYLGMMTEGLKCKPNDYLKDFSTEAIADVIIRVESNSKRV